MPDRTPGPARRTVKQKRGTVTNRSIVYDERGQSTLELALCLPVIVVILVALLETGLVAGDQVRLWHAAREAARAAAVDRAPEAALNAARRTGLEGVEVSVDPQPSYRSMGEPLTVELAYRPRGRSPVVGDLFERLELHASATMRIELP